jgi:hypothetical protein
LFIDRMVIVTENPQAPLPRVTVDASDPTATESGDPGSFTISRNNSNGPLTVSYMIDGSASAGSDYGTLSGNVTLVDGQSTVSVAIVPIDDTAVEGNESVIITLVAAPTYQIGFPSEASIEIVDDDSVALDVDANAQTTITGSVAFGDLSSTFVDDDSNLQIREAASGGKRSRLEHRWTFDIGAGGTSTCFLQAHRTTTENFLFAFSTNGTTWTNMLTVTKTSDDDSYQQFVLPPGVSGNVQVRVLDADNTKFESVLDSIYVDDMFIRGVQ